MDIQWLCGALIIQHLMIVNSFVLDHMIIQFVYGMLITTNKFNHSMDIPILCIVQNFHHIIIITIAKMSFVLHRVIKPFVFGISNIINNYKYSMDTLVVFVELDFHHLMVVDIYVLDHMTKQF
ncbi:hypothetical protein RFI_25301, partial [Reticulomyxa filosa]